MTCHECGSQEHVLHDCPKWNAVLKEFAKDEKREQRVIDRINVYVVLNSGKMIELPWSDEVGVEEFEPKDACEQAAQRLRAGEAVYGRLIDEDGNVSETFRFFSVEPRSIELVFANA